MTIVEFTHHPHPVAERAGLLPIVWKERFRFAWWARLMAAGTECHPALGHITYRIVP